MISICTSYYNRKPQFLKTLESIEASAVTDYEIIVVDDCSSEEHQLLDVIEKNDKMALIQIHPEDKYWLNPCVPYNMAFAMAKGDIIIIQNPECMHVGDILAYTENNLKKYSYLAFSCLSWDQTPIDLDRAPSISHMAGGQGNLGWYNHSSICPRPYHFCTAIHKSNLDLLKGFDERLAKGLCYDDDDFLRRVRKLGLKVTAVDQPYVIHQWHDSSHIFQEDSHQKFLDNQALYNKILTGELESWS